MLRLADVALHALVVANPATSEIFHRRCLAPLTQAGRFAPLLEATLRGYLDHGLRFGDTARALGVHANTLRHRLDRYQQLTGIDLRDLEDLVTLWWALTARTRTQAMRDADRDTPAAPC